MTPRILIVSPVRNEAAHIHRVARALAAQRLRPARWIVVDDASDDGTPVALRNLEREIPFLTVISRPATDPATPDRLAAAAAPRAFNAGLGHAGDLRRYTHVMKLDGDIELPEDYLERLMDRFDRDARLGLAGGVLDEPTKSGRRRRIRIPRTHVHGALKCYSTACFEDIGGIQERLGWDTIDETYVRMGGLRVWSFPDLVALHHRPLGSADGVLRGHARHGACAYITHLSLWWVVLRGMKIGATRWPTGVSGAAFVGGYLRAALRREERVPDLEFRRFTRRDLRRRALRALSPTFRP